MPNLASLAKEQVAAVAAGNANTLWYLGNFMKVHVDSSATNGQFALLETWMRPGSEPPLHIHEREDETFVVLEGEIEIVCGGQTQILRAGESRFAPRLVPHTFRVLTPVARTFNIVTPGGFEDFFRILGHPAENRETPDRLPQPSFERVADVAARFGIRIAG